MPGGRGERAQVVAARAAGMEVGGLEHGAEPVGRPLELGVAAGRRPARARWSAREAEQHAQRGRLAGAVRAEEAGDRACLEREGEVLRPRRSAPNRFERESARTTGDMPFTLSEYVQDPSGPVWIALVAIGEEQGADLLRALGEELRRVAGSAGCGVPR